MKFIYIILFFIITSCATNKAHYQNMTQQEKVDVNYDARETQKVLNKNQKHRKSNAKKREKARVDYNDKVAREKAEANRNKKKHNGNFNFYR